MQLKREEEFFRQKAGFDWFNDRERNTKFFHDAVRGRRSSLKIQGIHNDKEDYLDNQDDIVEDATNFYQHQFHKQEDVDDFSMLDKLLRVVTDDQNVKFKSIPTIEKLKIEVMGLNRNSAASPDGKTDAFFQDS